MFCLTPDTPGMHNTSGTTFPLFRSCSIFFVSVACPNQRSSHQYHSGGNLPQHRACEGMCAAREDTAGHSTSQSKYPCRSGDRSTRFFIQDKMHLFFGLALPRWRWEVLGLRHYMSADEAAVDPNPTVDAIARPRQLGRRDDDICSGRDCTATPRLCDACENQGFRSFKHVNNSMDGGAHYDSPTFRGHKQASMIF